jgi:hypothetical protein
LRQTTLTQCYAPRLPVDTHPAVARAPNSAGLRMVEIEGQKYLINDTTGQVHLVPAKPKVSVEARSLSPVELSRDSFEETHVTPTQQPIKKRAVATSSTYQLSDNDESESDEDLVYVPRPKKKKDTKVQQSQVQALLLASDRGASYAAEGYSAASSGSETDLGSKY